MNRLSTDTLRQLPKDILLPEYSSDEIAAGVVHFGAGNFHRAHQAVYFDSLLNRGETGWGITGVSMRSSGVHQRLEPQDFLYTQVILGEQTQYRVIGSIKKILVAAVDPVAVIDAVAQASTQLVTTTITEKGYCLKDGGVNPNHPDLMHDLTSLQDPRTVFGFIAAALIKRAALNLPPLTVLCCDNMNAGGEHLQKGVQMVLTKHAPALVSWADEQVSFCASMVDRVTPATNDALLHQVRDKLGVNDQAPVATEDFSQWIIEDKFAGQRPALDKVGAVFVKDIAPYEKVKLRFLNASHSMLAALGYLAGDAYIHEAMQRPGLALFTERAMKETVLAVTEVPDSIDGVVYIDQVFRRFRNHHLPYAVLQVGTDSSLKIQQRWFPSLDDALRDSKNTNVFAFALASWVAFIRLASRQGDLNDPMADQFAQLPVDTHSDLVAACLAIAGAEQFAFYQDAQFMSQVRDYYQLIAELGVEQALVRFQA